MSLKKPQLLFLIFSIFGVFLYSNMKNSSTNPKKFPPQIYVSQYSSRGIVDRSINLKITSVHKRNSTTEVVAFVSMPFDFKGKIQYKWTLGQDVHLLEGQLAGDSEADFRRSIPQQIRILVSGYGPENLRHIGFEAWADKNGRRLYAEGLISSQKENSFEDIVQHVEKLKAEKSGIKK